MERAIPVASCSYSSVASSSAQRSVQRRSHSMPSCMNRQAPRRSIGANWPAQTLAASNKNSNQRSRLVACSASKDEPIQGYTPANYIQYSDFPEHRCHSIVGVAVDAPASVCFELWNDWLRLMDFLDLVSQIGLDKDNPDMGLFQSFYRWGRLPVMEIVFLVHKTHVEENKLIQFETLWGMPAQGEVEFIEDGPNKTLVTFRLELQMPALLVDMKVGTMGVEESLRKIFAENMADYKQLAETLATDPSRAPPRKEAASSSTSTSSKAAEGKGSRRGKSAGTEDADSSSTAAASSSGRASPAPKAAPGAAKSGRASPGAAQQAADSEGSKRSTGRKSAAPGSSRAKSKAG